MNLARLRKKANLTQQQVADQMGACIRTIHNWETGKTEPKQSTEKKLIKLLEKEGSKKKESRLKIGS